MKKVLSLLLVTLMLLALLAGCAKPAEPADNPPASSEPAAPAEPAESAAPAEPAEPAEPKEILVGCNFEPPTLDPQNTVEANAEEIISLCSEGLVRNRNGQIVPGIATDWEISEDGYEYTFHLRESTWADGTPLTAHDFEYTFLRVIDPTQAYEQAEFAYSVLENAQAYHTGEITDPNLVGVHAIDDYTLVIRTTIPSIETLITLARYPWAPIKEEIATAAGISYGAEGDKVSCNGPFKLVEWSHQDKVVLEKNENYWDKDSIKMDKITFVIGAENQTGADMMLADSLDYMTTTSSEVMQQLKDAGFGMGSYSTHMQCLLFGGRNDEVKLFMDNPNFKLALNLAVDRKAITDTLFTGGIPATRITTPSTKGVNGLFVDEYPYEGWPVNGDPVKAKEYLDIALQELGKTLEEVPELSILCYESANSVMVIQAVQDMFLNVLGIQCKIDQLPIQQMFSKVFANDFDLWWTGMAVGTMDWGSPDAFLKSFDWRNESYTGVWKDEEFARLYDIVLTTRDMQERKDCLFEIEKILIRDNPPFILVAYTQQFVIYNPELTGPEYVGRDDITYMDYVS